MSEVIVDTLKHSGNSSTANVTLASSGAVTTADDLTVGDNLIATKQNGCQRIILEQFFHPCDGSTIATSGGNVTLQNVTSSYTLSASYADLTGSTISYVPPTGTTMVIYRFNYQHGVDSAHNMSHNKFYIDSDEIVYKRHCVGANGWLEAMPNIEFAIPIGGTASTNTGRVASWTSAKTLKIQNRAYNSENDPKMHTTYHWDGAASAQFHQPSIGITAIG